MKGSMHLLKRLELMGYKIYVLSGFAYKFKPETGSENVVVPSEPNLSASSNIDLRLARELPHNQN